jgi:ribose transport system permease protein
MTSDVRSVGWGARVAPHAAWLLVLAVLGGFALADQAVLSPRNLANILVQASYMTVFACAQMFVIVVRGFDLSLGAGVSLVSVVAALVSTTVGADANAPAWAVAAGLAAGLATGALLGLFNGLCTAFLRVNPFIVTLGSMSVAFGLASIVSGGRPVFGIPDEFSDLLYGDLHGLPIPVLIAAVLCALAHALLRRTVFGRAIYLMGANPRAAHVAGLPTRAVLVATYVLASLFVALGALMLTARTGSGEPNLGASLLMPSIAAAVIGGISLQGGIGGVGQAVLGALFISILSNGMNLAEVNGYVQDIVLGLVILAALFLDRFRKGR